MDLNEKFNNTYSWLNLRNDSAIKLFLLCQQLGVKNCLTPDKFHVSLTVSDVDDMDISPYIKRNESYRVSFPTLSMLNGCLVLEFHHPTLHKLVKERDRMGFKSVYDDIRLHITLSYDPQITDIEFQEMQNKIMSGNLVLYLDGEQFTQKLDKTKMKKKLKEVSKISNNLNISEKESPCWKGYKKVKGKKDYEPGSCEKISEQQELSGKKEKILMHPKIKKVAVKLRYNPNTSKSTNL